MFNRKKRAPEHPVVREPMPDRGSPNPVVSEKGTRPAEICDICGGISLAGFKRCERHVGVVYESHAKTDAPETRGA